MLQIAIVAVTGALAFGVVPGLDVSGKGARGSVRS